MFDVRKIRPVKGWHDLFNEIGIIVIGVSIALVGEQIVDTWHARKQVGQARLALASDVANLVWYARERTLYGPCITRRLDEIGGILATAAETQRLPAVGLPGSPSIRVYSLSSWTPLTASGLAARFPREELSAYSDLVVSGEEMTALNRSEIIIWTDLAAIAGPGRPVSREEIGQLIRSLGQARYYARVLRLWSDNALDIIQHSHFPLDVEVDRDARREWNATRRKVANRAICQPLGASPAIYGQAPFDNVPLSGPVPSN